MTRKQKGTVIKFNPDKWGSLRDHLIDTMHGWNKSDAALLDETVRALLFVLSKGAVNK